MHRCVALSLFIYYKKIICILKCKVVKNEILKMVARYYLRVLASAEFNVFSIRG